MLLCFIQLRVRSAEDVILYLFSFTYLLPLSYFLGKVTHYQHSLCCESSYSFPFKTLVRRRRRRKRKLKAYDCPSYKENIYANTTLYVYWLSHYNLITLFTQCSLTQMCNIIMKINSLTR